MSEMSRIPASRQKMASMAEQYTWTDEDVEKLIRLRAENDYMFSGKRNAAQLGWETVLKEMGVADKVSQAMAQKKWGDLKKKFKELKQPPLGVETESGDTIARSWKWFELMDAAIGWRLSMPPLFLISSASPTYGSTELLETDDSDPEFSPLPPKRQRKDPLLEFLEREAERTEARERRAEEREEKLLNLLERIVDKM